MFEMESRIARDEVAPENLELLKIALKTAELAEENILKFYQNDVGVEWKADKTPVTIADKGTEELARKFWAKETPGFGVIGEEFGIENPDAEFQWVIDPIDGTKSFIHGVPLFGTLIALYHKNVPIASVIRLPAMKSAVWAVNGGGAFLDGREVHASKVSQLSDALVLSGTVNTMEDKGFGEGFTKLRHTFLAEFRGEPEMKEHEEFVWINIADLKEDEWAAADAAIIRKIRLNYGDLTEKRVSGEDIFSGKIMNVKRDVVLLPDGKTATRELIRHKGAAGVLVVDDRENVYLCKQYRYPIGRATLEIPAGKRDTMTEDYKETALRELREELGVIDAELTPMGKMLPAVGYSDEVIALFLAEQPTFGQQDLDEDEFLNVVVLPFKDALKMCMDGTIEDSKTLVALLKYKAMKNL